MMFKVHFPLLCLKIKSWIKIDSFVFVVIRALIDLAAMPLKALQDYCIQAYLMQKLGIPQDVFVHLFLVGKYLFLRISCYLFSHLNELNLKIVDQCTCDP